MICKARTTRGVMMAIVIGALSGCDEGLGPLSSVDAPRSLTVEPVSLNAVRLTWDRVADDDIAAYRVERRMNFSGSFETLPDQVVQPAGDLGLVVFFDTDVQPDTYYGYRVVSVSRFGERSGASIVGGARTPPHPGVIVTTHSTAPNSASLDPDGYRVRVSGPDSVTTALGLNDEKRFSPLRAGNYTVALEGVHPQCAVTGSSDRAVTVVDTGVNTVVGVDFQVTCRDPSRGEVVAMVQAQGDSLPGSYAITLVGLAADETLPDTARIVSRRQLIPSTTGGATTFANVRPGSYEVTLDSLASQCTVGGPATISVTVAAAQIDTVVFDVSCERDPGGGADGPYTWSNAWSVASAAPGSRVTLRVAIDVTANPALRIAAVQGEIRFDPAVLRFESYQAVPGGLDGPLWNNVQSGLIAGLSLDNAGVGKTGIIPVVDLEFTVIGAEGAQAITRTTVVEVVDANFDEYKDSTRVIEDTLTVGAGGAGQNQPPVAEANGPYSGTVGGAVAFSATGSSDPDGSIASYAWTFGDGSSGSGVTVSHAYASAGSYTATLTVTDDAGASATDQATVTITSSGGGTNQPPVAEANGPYNGIAGQAITFSAAGSADPDGSITSYQWTFGDGGSASGASVSHIYQTPGSYTAALTVSDDQGATATDQAVVTVTSGASQQPFLWSYAVGPADQNGIVAVTITYDLRTDIPETPGAEALQSWSVSSLQWDPTVLQYFAFNFGPGGGGSVNPTSAANGTLVFSGTQPATNNGGVITIATIRFKLVGAAGSATTTTTTLGSLLSTPGNGAFNYTSRTQVVEATIQR